MLKLKSAAAAAMSDDDDDQRRNFDKAAQVCGAVDDGAPDRGCL
jgi:hypothetical protein